MCYLNLLRLSFETAIDPWEAPDFRAAVMDYLGWGYDGLPLPEAGNKKGRLPDKSPAGRPANPFPYPLAQFKMRRYYGRYQPMLLCLGPQSARVKATIQAAGNASVTVNRRAYPLGVQEARLYRFRLQAGKGWHDYNIFKYQALNGDNYRRYRELKGEEERRAFLKDLLANHILTFAAGVGWQVGAPIEITNLHILREQQLPCRGIRYHCFDLSFRCNLFLPEYIGLGGAAAQGFGVVRVDRRGLS